MNISQQRINLGDISIDVFYKDIKNIHLSVHPPSGRVRMSSPKRISLDTLRVFAISKLSWIKKQQQRMKSQEREAQRDYVTRESHYYLGKRYLLNVIEHNYPPKVEIKHDTIELYIRPDTPREKRQSILNEWYRERLKEIIPPHIEKWEKVMKVNVNEWAIKRMKTRWGTCNTKAKRVWINLELAKKPIHCLEYIIVHEMVHLLERKHNDKFKTYMNQFLPQWKQNRQELNRFPISHTDWGY